jgi:hypothetical protein
LEQHCKYGLFMSYACSLTNRVASQPLHLDENI